MYIIVFLRIAFLNDVWLSVNNGVSWTLQTSAAQWSGRYGHSITVSGSNILIMGGTGNGKCLFQERNQIYIYREREIVWNL